MVNSREVPPAECLTQARRKQALEICAQSVQELVLEPHVWRLVTKLDRELPDDPARIAWGPK